MSDSRIFTKDDYYFPVGVFIQTLLHGAYTVLFVTALWIWKNRRSHAAASSLPIPALIYLILTVLMWIVASLHIGLSLERMLRVFILEVEVNSPITFLRLLDGTRWDTAAHLSLVAAMIWLGDILVVYRTYIVWNRMIWIILVPLVLDSGKLALNILVLYWYTRPHIYPIEKTLQYSSWLFPLAFAQNLLTTGLLSFKVWSQHRESVANGVIHNTNVHTLGDVARIMIESALLYPLELLIIIILNALKHPATDMVILFMVPSIGIIFVLMAVRIHIGTHLSDNSGARSGTANSFPNWVRNSSGDIELSRSASATASSRVDLAFRIPNKKSHLAPSDSDDHEAFSNPSLSHKPVLLPVS